MTNRITFANEAQRDAKRPRMPVCSSRNKLSRSKALAHRCLIAFTALLVTPFVSGAQVSQQTLCDSTGAHSITMNADMTRGAQQ